MKIIKHLILPDVHIPFQNTPALLLALAVGKKMDVGSIVILGDFADIYSCNSYGKKKGYHDLTLEDEMRAVNWWLDFIDEHFPKAEKTYIEGNHENRVKRKLEKDSHEFYGYVDFMGAAHLDSRHNWHFVEYGPNQLHRIGSTEFFARHEPYANSLNASMRKGMINLVFGHTHRDEHMSTRDAYGKRITQTSAGFLGDRESMVFKYARDVKSLGAHILYEYPDGSHKIVKFDICDKLNDTIFGGYHFKYLTKKKKIKVTKI